MTASTRQIPALRHKPQRAARVPRRCSRSTSSRATTPCLAYHPYARRHQSPRRPQMIWAASPSSTSAVGRGPTLVGFDDTYFMSLHVPTSGRARLSRASDAREKDAGPFLRDRLVNWGSPFHQCRRDSSRHSRLPTFLQHASTPPRRSGASRCRSGSGPRAPRGFSGSARVACVTSLVHKLAPGSSASSAGLRADSGVVRSLFGAHRRRVRARFSTDGGGVSDRSIR